MMTVTQSLHEPDQVSLTEDPVCEHGLMMVRRHGRSRKNNWWWAGWFCAETSDRCEPVWAEIDPIIAAALAAWQEGSAA
jgi:hypothetical protein